MNPSSSTFSVETTRVPRRRIVPLQTPIDRGQAYGYIAAIADRNSHPPYKNLADTARAVSSPDAKARARIKKMTARDADWQALGSAPPNDRSAAMAFDVLVMSYSKEMMEPSLVTASAEGGVGIIYRSPKQYAAIECLNSGAIWMLWFDAGGEPQSRRVRNNKKAIKEALEQVAALHANA